jgi:hypothetical protein
MAYKILSSGAIVLPLNYASEINQLVYLDQIFLFFFCSLKKTATEVRKVCLMAGRNISQQGLHGQPLATSRTCYHDVVWRATECIYVLVLQA